MKVKNNEAQDVVTKVYLEVRLDRLKIELEDTMKKYRNDVLNGLDKVVGELETAREDRIIANHKIDEIHEIIQEQGSRLTHFRKTPQ